MCNDILEFYCDCGLEITISVEDYKVLSFAEIYDATHCEKCSTPL